MNCQSNFKHGEPWRLTGMDIWRTIPLGIRIRFKHIIKMYKRESPPKHLIKVRAVPRSHTHWQALSAVYHIAQVLWKTRREAAVNAELFSHVRQRFPTPAQAGGKPTGPGVWAAPTHTSALERGYSMLHGKLQKLFSDAAIKILDTAEAMLPDKLMT